MIVQAGSMKLVVLITCKKFEINADNEQKYNGLS